MGMWDDIVIGDCEKSGGSTIIPSQRSGLYAPPKGTLTCKSRISESGRSFWITTDFLEMGMRIAKDTDEGRRLNALLALEKWDEIDDMLALIVLNRATPELIRTKITEAYSEAYQKGSDDRAAEIRKALGVERGW